MHAISRYHTHACASHCLTVSDRSHWWWRRCAACDAWGAPPATADPEVARNQPCLGMLTQQTLRGQHSVDSLAYAGAYALLELGLPACGEWLAYVNTGFTTRAKLTSGG